MRTPAFVSSRFDAQHALIAFFFSNIKIEMIAFSQNQSCSFFVDFWNANVVFLRNDETHETETRSNAYEWCALILIVSFLLHIYDLCVWATVTAIASETICHLLLLSDRQKIDLQKTIHENTDSKLVKFIWTRTTDIIKRVFTPLNEIVWFKVEILAKSTKHMFSNRSK